MVKRALVSALTMAGMLVGGVVIALPAHAVTLVTWTATGEIDRVDSGLVGDGVAIGDPFTVTFTFDTDAVDNSGGDSTRGDYGDLITEVQVEVGSSFTASASNGGAFLAGSSVVFDDWTGPAGGDPAEDRWWMQAQEGWSGDDLNDETVRFLQRFLDFLDSDALPNTPPDPAPFELADFVLTFGAAGERISGPVASLVVAGGGGDADGDGVPDSDDTCPGFDDTVDVDDDGIPDGCDPLVDSDGDGVADSDDVCPGFDDTVDTDDDGIPDGCDPDVSPDRDGDGVPDSQDFCPDDTVLTWFPERHNGVSYYLEDGLFLSGFPQHRPFTLAEMGGCDALQIIELAELGEGHAKVGLSPGSMVDWFLFVN